MSLSLLSSVALAGSGTQADPWRTLNIYYSWSNNGTPSRTFQDIRGTQIANDTVTFWAYSPVLRRTDGVQSTTYIGIQTKGTLKGNQNGVVVFKSAHFSIIGNGNTINNLQPSNCSSGADGGFGVSCAISYGWATGATNRVTESFSYNVSTPGWCSPGLASCTVAVGAVGSSQIGAFSYAPGAYGVMQSANSFLEIPLNTGGSCAAPAPRGEFVIPYKTIAGTDVAVTTVSGSDRYDTIYPQTCARTYNNWVVTYMYY